jgi:hypothetical protein
MQSGNQRLYQVRHHREPPGRDPNPPAVIPMQREGVSTPNISLQPPSRSSHIFLIYRQRMASSAMVTSGKGGSDIFAGLNMRNH